MNEISPVLIAVGNAILMAALPVLVVTMIAAIGGWARKEWALFKAAQPTISDQLAMYARIAVEAAEQAGLAKLIASKKEYAIEIVVRLLSQVGLNGIDVELIEAEIERQVGKMNFQKSLLSNKGA